MRKHFSFQFGIVSLAIEKISPLNQQHWLRGDFLFLKAELFHQCFLQNSRDIA